MIDFNNINDRDSGLLVRTKLNNMLKNLISGKEGLNTLWSTFKSLVEQVTKNQQEILSAINALKKQVLNTTNYTDKKVAESLQTSRKYVDNLVEPLNKDVDALSYRVTTTESELGPLASRVTQLEQQDVTGLETYLKYSDLPSTGNARTSYKVTNDPTSTKNGYYSWDGSKYVKSLIDDGYIWEKTQVTTTRIGGIPKNTNLAGKTLTQILEMALYNRGGDFF